MKEKLTRNIGLKVLSIILAAILWLVITNVDDPITKESYYNVPVEILNKKALASLDKVYEVIEGDTIDFTVAARRQVADKLSVSDFRVTADFSKLSDVNAVTIDIKCPRYSDEVTVTDGLYQVMKVELEDLREKRFNVNVIVNGEPADGYTVGQKASNTILKVSGPESKMEKIAKVVVEVDVTDVSKTFKTSEVPKALDEDGNEIDASNLEFSMDSVEIDIIMYRKKEIDLLVDTIGRPAEGFVLTDAYCAPEKIEIAAEDETLKKINSLTIIESIEGANQKIEKEVILQDQIKEQLGEGIILVDDNPTVVINITIERAKTKEIMIQTEELQVRNQPEELNVFYLSSLPITIRLSGPGEIINDLSVKDIKPFIDLANYSSANTYNIAIGVELPELTTLTNNPSVSLYLVQ